MPLTITRTGDWVGNPGDRISGRITIAFSSSYPTGGEALTPADFGLGQVDLVIAGPKNGYVFEYDYATSKLKAYVSAAAASALGEVANATNLSTLTGVPAFAIGRP